MFFPGHYCKIIGIDKNKILDPVGLTVGNTVQVKTK